MIVSSLAVVGASPATATHDCDPDATLCDGENGHDADVVLPPGMEKPVVEHLVRAAPHAYRAAKLAKECCVTVGDAHVSVAPPGAGSAVQSSGPSAAGSGSGANGFGEGGFGEGGYGGVSSTASKSVRRSGGRARGKAPGGPTISNAGGAGGEPEFDPTED
jgi:hypothetical protein